jgi:hypothetical protein
MPSRARAVVVVMVAAVALAITPAAAGKGGAKLNMYTVKGEAATITEAAPGVELVDVRPRPPESRPTRS